MATLNHRIRTLALLGGKDRLEATDRWLFLNPAAGRALLEGRPVERVAEALSSLMDFHGLEPDSHNRRLAAWCRLLGAVAGLDDQALLDLHLASLAHDVGKVAVPDAILKSADALGPTELDRVKMHSSLGHALLFGCEGFFGASEIVLRHHEYWDGSGYHGLRGRKIPRGARVFAIVDSYDAMLRTDRPYRVCTAEEAAREEILRLAARRYDPELVSVWSGIDRGRWNEILSRLPDTAEAHVTVAG